MIPYTPHAALYVTFAEARGGLVLLEDVPYAPDPFW